MHSVASTLATSASSSNNNNFAATVSIPYSIAGSAEHTPRYGGENIKYDRPRDQHSRWSGKRVGAGLNARPWILLQLKHTSVLQTITFGKFYKVHPCNLKEFKLLVGMSEDNMTEVLHATLKNDEKPETFRVPHVTEHGVPFPTKFMKIVTISSHANNFNISIWHVALAGIVDDKVVHNVATEYDHHREAIAMRHVLKFLRQRRHITTYHHLLKRTGTRLEHPLVSELYNSLVLHGDFSLVESLLHDIGREGLYNTYIHSCPPCARWKRLRPVDDDGVPYAPSARGGHAMCMDVEKGLIYLFGGWNGHRSLDDFWVYYIATGRWQEICASVGQQKNGPGPRACHKMEFDPKTGCIYMLGRLSDQDCPPHVVPVAVSDDGSSTEREGGGGDDPGTGVNAGLETRRRRSVGVGTAATTPGVSGTRASCSEFHRYRTRGIDQGNWELLTFDTYSSGGPQLIYDHQMAIDSEAQILYVQGGRVVDGDWENIKYSGLYAYEIRKNKWTLIIPTVSSDPIIPPRFGHSMIFDSIRRELMVFMGQHDDRYLSDIWLYDINSSTLSEICSNFTANGGPEPCFAQRAVVDPRLQEIYVFAGLTRSSITSVASTGSAVWMYRYGKRPGTWTKILPVQQPVVASPSSSHTSPSAKRPRNADSVPAPVASPESPSSEDDNVSVDPNDVEPIGRCAHQVAYDPRTQTFYMHGGNAGSSHSGPQIDESGREIVRDPDGVVDGREEYAKYDVSERRLDDFWTMTLERPSPDEIVRKAIFEIRKQQFREMCEDSDPMKALNFLQNEVYSVVDHSNNTEAATFRSLLSHLLARSPQPDASLAAGPSVFKGEDTGSTDSSESSTPSLAPSDKDAAWTDSLLEQDLNADDDAIMLDASLSTYSNTPTSKPRTNLHHIFEDTNYATEDDPYELGMRAGRTLPQARFEQRTEVFEALLKFVSAEAKQPDGSLLDIACKDEL